MNSFIEKHFCPLMSTANNKVDCDSKCMWYVYNDDCSNNTCAVSLNFISNSSLLSEIENNTNK